MPHESAPIELSVYRFRKAETLLQDAKLLLSAGQWSSANNRAYYCIFHGMRAVLALQQLDFKKHSAVIAAFNKDYVHTGAFKREFLTMINNASIIRNHSDYDDFYICDREETVALIEDSERFLSAVMEYLRQKGCQIDSIE